MSVVFHAHPLTRAIEAIVAAGGSAPREARLVAENLVMANLLGHDSHGVGMIPRYVAALLEGGLSANRHPRIALDAVGIPLLGEPPFLLDMATSAVAQGKMRVAHNKRDKVAAGLLIDDRGNPTDDPRYAVVPPLGAILPFGGHKGYGVALACELLGGALSGGGTWHYDESSKQRVLNGMLAIVIDPGKLGTGAQFAAESRQFLDWLRRSAVAPGFDKVRIAGEPERDTRARREMEGIPVDETTWSEIVAAGAKLKLRKEALQQLAEGR
jgi:LDH2 family malate/lactate/ureidoglycolate dehydrogenase